MARFISSDHHLGEDRMVIMGRPFRTGQECVEAMIANHNSVVSPDDEVIFLGDVCYQKTPEMLPWVAKFHGKKVLVRGNHDRGIPDSEFLKYFDSVIPDGGRMNLQAGGIDCVAVHYPTEGDANAFNLVGHIHAAWKYQLNMLNVGVDVHHYYPVDLEKVPFHLKAIQEFYDDDVWVAYDKINLKWFGSRGKNGTYFRPEAKLKKSVSINESSDGILLQSTYDVGRQVPTGT